MNKILVVDDEAHILELLTFNLEKEGYQVVGATDGEEALIKLGEFKPDLVILDVMLPGIDGLRICKTITQNPQTKDLPIIMLTAKSEELDKVLGLDMGADDYMTKPFSTRELLARVRARLRRKVEPANYDKKDKSIITRENIKMDIERFQVTVDDRDVDLTPKEFELLQLLISNPGKVFTRDNLLEKVWGYEYAGDSRTVDVHIRHLRQKIEAEPSQPRFLETVRGVGYRFKERV